MAKELEPIEIGVMPEVVRLAEEVRASGAPRRLRRGGQDVAVLAPTKRPQLDQSAVKAWEETLGRWSHLDVEAMVERVYRWREEGSRPVTRP